MAVLRAKVKNNNFVVIHHYEKRKCENLERNNNIFVENDGW